MKAREEKIYSDFLSWFEERNKNMGTLNKENFIESMNGVGLSIEFLFEEKNSSKIRKKIIELIEEQNKHKHKTRNLYINSIYIMTVYAEFLDYMKDLKKKSREDDKKLEDSLAITYYLSRTNVEGLKKLGYKSFASAFKDLAEILQQKPATLKNMRDEFDPYFDNGRAGWYQRELSPSRKKVFDYFSNITDEELEEEIRDILKKYKNKTRHKTIVITSNKMKEVKSK